MLRFVITALSIVFSVVSMDLWAHDVIVADSATRIPLPNASIYDRDGKPVGLTHSNGALPKIASSRYPLSVRYLGFNDKTVMYECEDTVFLSEMISELPEVAVESSKLRVLHILAYIREYSTLATYTDTVFLFREKMVDFMLPADNKVKYKGWSSPRVLTSRSYYRFTNNNGLDSVSDACQHHFSWSDWIDLPPTISMPIGIKRNNYTTDTVRGKYSPTEIWHRYNDTLRVDIDVLADTASRKWVPTLAKFFRRNLDFEKFKVSFKYCDILGDSVSKFDLDSFAISIESNGRSREMFRFNRTNEPFFVTTDAEIYFIDKEYITVKEAKKWEKRVFDVDEIGIYEPPGAPLLPTTILNLVERVNNIDKERIRLDVTPDQRLMGIKDSRRNFRIGRRALLLLKQITGISLYESHKNFNNNWKQFRRRTTARNAEESN